MGAEEPGRQETNNAPKKAPREKLKSLFDNDPELQEKLKQRGENERKEDEEARKEKAKADALLKTMQ